MDDSRGIGEGGNFLSGEADGDLIAGFAEPSSMQTWGYPRIQRSDGMWKRIEPPATLLQRRVSW